MVAPNTSFITIKSFTVNNTKAYTFQIKTPISFKKRNTGSVGTGNDIFNFNSMDIQIYEDGILYLSSVPSDYTTPLLKVYYKSFSELSQS